MTDLEKLEGYRNLSAALDEFKAIQEAYERGEEYIIEGEGCKAGRMPIKVFFAQRSYKLEHWLKMFNQPEFEDIKEKIRAKVKELEVCLGDKNNRNKGIDR